MHVEIDEKHQLRKFQCNEHPNSLCISANGSTVLFPNTGSVVVAADPFAKVPHAVFLLQNKTCNWRNIGLGRVVVDTDRYDISACDIYSMTASFFLFRSEIYVIPLPFPPVLHFLMCIASMAIVSGIMYVLRPQTQFLLPAANGTMTVNPPSQLPIDFAMFVCTASVASACGVQIVNRTFLTVEDRVGFALLSGAFGFYFLCALLSRFGWGGGEVKKLYGIWFSQYEAGVSLDAFVCGLLLLCVCMYSTLQHPFKYVSTALLLFRQWHKLIRFSYGETFIVTYPYSIPYVLLRFFVDSLNISFSIAYGAFLTTLRASVFSADVV
jgi:hypothetical protein